VNTVPDTLVDTVHLIFNIGKIDKNWSKCGNL
jgi:hypothetical protein